MRFFRQNAERTTINEELDEQDEKPYDLRKAALDRYEAEKERKENTRLYEVNKEFENRFGMRPDAVKKNDNGTYLVYAQDYVFIAEQRMLGSWLFDLIWECRECCQTAPVTHSWTVYGLEELGYAIAYKYYTCINGERR